MPTNAFDCLRGEDILSLSSKGCTSSELVSLKLIFLGSGTCCDLSGDSSSTSFEGEEKLPVD